jgi:hypothetical protein
MLWMEEVPIEKWDVSDLVVAVFASFVSWIFGYCDPFWVIVL